MKRTLTKIMTVVLLFAFSASVFAQKPKTEQFINKAVSNFVLAMESKNAGVVESSIFISIDLKSKFPQIDYSDLIDKLNELALKGETPTIRYKAQLASLYFNFYNMFSDIKIVDKENPDLYFKQIAERLEQPAVAFK